MPTLCTYPSTLWTNETQNGLPSAPKRLPSSSLPFNLPTLLARPLARSTTSTTTRKLAQLATSPSNLRRNTPTPSNTSSGRAPILHLRLQAIHRLGERLCFVGADEWWTQEPTPPNFSAYLHTQTLTERYAPETVLPADLRLALFVEHKLSVPLAPALSANRHRHIAAQYLFSLAYRTSVSPTSPITPDLLDSLPIFTSPAQCAQVLHPALIEAAIHLYDCNTGINATPPYLDPRLPLHLSTNPSSLLPSLGTHTIPPLSIS